MDAEVYPPEDLAELYFQRWDVELDFRHIKITMQMDVLRCKTAQMVRKEFWCHLLAYNLIRHLMWDARQSQMGCHVRSSFKGAIQYLISFRVLYSIATPQQKTAVLKRLLASISAQQVPCRPYRVEPRVKKRRPKKYKLMNKPRVELKAALIGA